MLRLHSRRFKDGRWHGVFVAQVGFKRSQLPGTGFKFNCCCPVSWELIMLLSDSRRFKDSR
jgi:hypothetical protein